MKIPFMENPIYQWMIWGGSPILGNHMNLIEMGILINWPIIPINMIEMIDYWDIRWDQLMYSWDY